MGLIERFFKLTLDNVYRFICSLIFLVALIAYSRHISPVAQLSELLDWLGVPSSWLTAVSGWIGQRQGVLAIVATLVLLVAILFATANDWRSRSGSTSLLASALLIQVGFGWWLIAGPFIALAVVALVTGGAVFVVGRLGFSHPDWPGSAWERVWNVCLTLFLAAAYVLSPLGWLISQDPHNVRGSRLNPLFIQQITKTGPSGATAP